VRELARFREEYAQGRNVPRARVLKDDALLELASTRPTNHEELGRSRLLLREARRGDIADGILSAVKTAMDLPAEALPRPPEDDRPAQGNGALSDLLRVLLKARADGEGVASKLIATSSDLDALAAGARDLPALKGWRREVFGDDALRLCDGKIALSARGGQVRVVDLPG
jgi:ribonuclease D